MIDDPDAEYRRVTNQPDEEPHDISKRVLIVGGIVWIVGIMLLAWYVYS